MSTPPPASLSPPADVLARCAALLDARRALARAENTDAFRVIHSAADGFAGLTVDSLGPALLVEQHRADADPSALIAALVALVGADVPIFLKMRFGRDPAQYGGRQVSGPPHGGVLDVCEDGLRFRVHLLGETHIGLFLDGRKARALVAAKTAGKRVLNLFSYTGGFGVAAATGGARSTVNIDNKASALRLAERNYAANGLAFDARTFFRCDALDYLRRAARQQARFDWIILDPPPRFYSHRRLWEMHRDYGKLLARCLAVVAPEATLMAGLNALRASDDAFVDMVAEAFGAHPDIAWEVRQFAGPGDDFPFSADRPVARFALIAVRPRA
ncbi:MAG: class I SAM-dependent methyltransferase [Proteobacteria bacterium]|nr:class I SAM-dependent methyltransferase [Pseudomonadota bacterium]